MPMRCSRETACASSLDVALAAPGCASAPAGGGLTAVFAVGPDFLGDSGRADTFFAVFLLVVRAFLAAFLRMAALVGAFFRFRPALLFAFLLVAITRSLRSRV